VQVAARLAAAGRNRALWPHAAQHEVEQLEQQLETLQVGWGTASASADGGGDGGFALCRQQQQTALCDCVCVCLWSDTAY
jgi:hypothetical protein